MKNVHKTLADPRYFDLYNQHQSPLWTGHTISHVKHTQYSAACFEQNIYRFTQITLHEIITQLTHLM